MIPHPLRLAVGSHEAGSGKGCAMNVLSYENGDTTITDLPACTDLMLARLVQYINDDTCTHRDGDLLCPACSIKVLALAHRTVGTGMTSYGTRKLVWVRVAITAAREVLDLLDGESRTKAERAIGAAEAWLAKPSPDSQHVARVAANGAYAFALRGKQFAALSAARNAAWAAFGTASAASSASSDTADAILNSIAASAGDDPEARLAAAHRFIDLFMELSGHTEQHPDEARTAEAVRAMQRVTA